MIFTNDIYQIVGFNLEEAGYNDIREVSPNILKEEIKKYLMLKLHETDDDLEFDILFKRLESFIVEPEKTKEMGVFIHYLLWYMGMLQGFEMVWYMEEDATEPRLKENTVFPGMLDGLVTSKEIDYLKTFNFVLEECKKIKNERGRI